MYIESVPSRGARPTILLREGHREGRRVVKRTLANLTHWPADKVDRLRRVLRDEPLVPAEQTGRVLSSLPHGHVEAALAVAHRIGLPEILGSRRSPSRDRVLALVVQRVLKPASKLATAELLGTSTLAEELGMTDISEDDLYATMDWLGKRQTWIEKNLAARHLRNGDSALYDASSSYYEGRTCTLMRFGYSRDGKRGRPIVVYGLMTDAAGRPLSIQAYPGDTGDAATVSDQVDKLRGRFGLDQVVLVGDRGMLTQTCIERGRQHPGIGWISALRSDGLRRLVEDRSLQPSLFDEVLLHGTQAAGFSRRKKGQRGLLDLDPAPRFDLVIVDEAHHARNPKTYTHEAVRFFCDNAEAVVFLTATPLQLGSDELFVLLNLLRPDLIIDRESFQHMAAPNSYINRAIDAARGGAAGWQQEAVRALEDAALTDWGQRILSEDPEYRSVKVKLAAEALSPEDRVSAIHTLEGLHTFSGIINRTRRRDIGEFTIREPRTVSVEFTPVQRELHDSLLTIQMRVLSKIHPTQNINFMMTTIRRQAASCLFGLAPLIKDILNRRIADVRDQESSDEYEMLDSAAAEEVLGEIEGIVERTEQLEGTKDPKLEALEGIIRDKQNLDNNKLMVFSSFRHTLSYLFAKLSSNGVRAGMVHGGTPDEARIEIRERFRRSCQDAEAIDVLLFSEVGCEGLDYQFCDCIVNYDLPWNPMRIEQRIGRIDRKGQKSEQILIYNLITPETVDADIYERCLVRIGVFNSALGTSEKILGEIAREIRSIADDVQLSNGKRKERLQQIADNQIRLMQEQQILEDQQAELFGIRLPADQTQKDIEGASSFWLSAGSIQNLAATYLREVLGKSQEYIIGEKATKSLRISQEGRARLLKDFQALPRIGSLTYKQWEDWLKGGDPHLAITFDAQEAVENQNAVFVTPLHPLARQAARAMEPHAAKPVCVVRAADDAIIPSEYPFVIYEWTYTGVRDDLVLYPIAESPDVSRRLADLLEYGRSSGVADEQMPDQAAFDRLDAAHYERWAEARSKHKNQNQRIVDYRRESLTTSHRARVAMLEDRLANATNDKILRMRRAQITNAGEDFKRHVADLEQAVSRADLNAEPVAYGVVVVSPDQADG